jgi:transposase
VRPRSWNGLHPIAFLVPRGRWAGDRLLVLWDGSPSHRRAEVGGFVAKARGTIRGERLPSYALDLNPVEGLWRHLKGVEWRNVSCWDLDQLHLEFPLALGRVRQKQRLMPTFFEGAELAV